MTTNEIGDTSRRGVRRKRIAIDLTALASIRLPYGKHRGKTIADVYAEEPDYLTWLVRIGSKPDTHTALRRLAPAARNYLKAVAA